MFSNDEFSFPSGQSLCIPKGTNARIKVRLNDDLSPRVASDWNVRGRWLRIDFKVVDGPYGGRNAAMMLTLDPMDKGFRAAVGIITGVDLSKGATLNSNVILDALKLHEFSAVLGPQVRNGEATEFTNANELIERF